MTPEQRHAYLVELLKVGFNDQDALKIVDEAEKRINFEDGMAAWRQSLTAIKESDRPARKSPPRPQPPVPVWDSRPAERAHRVIVRQILQQTRPPAPKEGERVGFMQAFERDFRRGLQELQGFSLEEIEYIVGPDRDEIAEA